VSERTRVQGGAAGAPPVDNLPRPLDRQLHMPAACPLSTRGGTRLVRSVRGEGRYRTCCPTAAQRPAPQAGAAHEGGTARGGQGRGHAGGRAGAAGLADRRVGEREGERRAAAAASACGVAEGSVPPGLRARRVSARARELAVPRAARQRASAAAAPTPSNPGRAESAASCPVITGGGRDWAEPARQHRWDLDRQPARRGRRGGAGARARRRRGRRRRARGGRLQARDGRAAHCDRWRRALAQLRTKGATCVTLARGPGSGSVPPGRAGAHGVRGAAAGAGRGARACGATGAIRFANPLLPAPRVGACAARREAREMQGRGARGGERGAGACLYADIGRAGRAYAPPPGDTARGSILRACETGMRRGAARRSGGRGAGGAVGAGSTRRPMWRGPVQPAAQECCTAAPPDHFCSSAPPFTHLVGAGAARGARFRQGAGGGTPLGAWLATRPALAFMRIELHRRGERG
jgi:hypothetical protein